VVAATWIAIPDDEDEDDFKLIVFKTDFNLAAWA
jgi:hypothetical protein